MGRINNYDEEELERQEVGLERAYFGASLETLCQQIAALRLDAKRSVGSLEALLADGEFPEDEEAFSAWMASVESLGYRLEIFEKNTEAMQRRMVKKPVRVIPEGA